MNKFAAYASLALALALSIPAFSASVPEKDGVPAVSQKNVKTFKPDANMDRASVPDNYKWDLSPLYKNDTEFESALSTIGAGIDHLKKYKGCLQDPEMLFNCLQEYFEVRAQANRATLYTNLRLTTDLRNPEIQAMDEQSQAMMRYFMASTAFIRDELLKLDGSVIEKASQEYPKMKEFIPWIDEARRRKDHILSPAEENLLSMAGDNQFAEIDLNELPSDFEKTFQALYSDIKLPVITDENGKKVQLTFSNYAKYRSSKDRRVRRETVTEFFKTLNDYRNTFAATMAGQVHFSSFLAKARGYDSAIQAYLDRDNIPEQVYVNVVDTVKNNTAPLHRYIKLRKKLMGLKDIHIYDLYTPMVPSAKRDISYDEARKIVAEALKPMGEDYLKTFTFGMDENNGWVDVYPHKDKDSGASCASIYGCHPFIKLNHLDSFSDMSTVAHEFGHAMHSILSFGKQPYPVAYYVPFVAEVASTCNEKFLSDYMIANAKNDEEKLYLINEMIDGIRTTIYRQALFADFEMQIHAASEKGTPLTAEFLNKTYADLIRQYYGPDFTVDEYDGVEWAYIPHLYYKFYVFSYAAGMSSGIAISEKVAKEGAPARDAYLEMLSGGCSKPPVELLKTAGIDITKPEAMKAAADLLDRLLDQMEEILNKKK
ncbi:oligoendopeptidase F [bacterium]|nr:oligoendopeptidase F [bacterium]